MNKRNSVPIAPAEVEYWLAVKLRAQGRKDAKKYAQLNDVTRTHAMVVAQNRANAGQRAVNRWLIRAAEPLHVGNARALVMFETFETERNRLEQLNEASGRNRRVTISRQEILQRELMNLQSQFEVVSDFNIDAFNRELDGTIRI